MRKIYGKVRKYDDTLYLTPGEVAAILGMPTRLLYQWIEMGQSPPAQTIAGTTRFAAKGLQQWLRAREEE